MSAHFKSVSGKKIMRLLQVTLRSFQKSGPSALSKMALFLFFIFLLSCSSGGSSQPGDPGLSEEETDTASGIDCTKTVESLIKNLDVDSDAIPSWDQLDCYTDNLTRKNTPSTVIMVRDIPPDENSSEPFPGVWTSLQNLTTFLDSWTNNEVSDLSDFPPYLSIDGSSSFYRESDARWDLKLRAMALNAIWTKQQGFRLRVTRFNPPSFFDQENWSKLNAQNISSSETFLTWWRTEYIPERKALAVMAERVKAEILMPWDVEPGMFLRSFGEDWLNDLSEDDQITLAQTIIDELSAALRPLFSGTLAIIVFDRYAAHGQHWDQLDVSSWDEVGFGFFTEGTLEATQSYLDDQLAGYMKIVQRSNIPWLGNEVTVDGATHRRLLSSSDPSFETIEEDIYRAIFTTFAAQTIKPSGIGLTGGYIETTGARSYVDSALADIGANGF